MSADPLLQELSQVAEALADALHPESAEPLLSSIAETARRLLGARACSLALLDEDRDELVYTTASGAGADVVTGLRMPAGRGIAGWVVQSGQPVAVSDVQRDPRFAPDVAEATGYLPQAIVAAPVVTDDEVLGVLSVLDRDASRPGADQDLLLLQAFCEQAAVALQGLRRQREMSQVLLRALAGAAQTGGGLADALAGEAPGAAEGVREVAALLARLGRHGAPAQELGIRVLREVLTFVEQSRA